MKLHINSELRSKCGGGSSEYWFSYRDYSVKNISELNTDDKPENMGQTTYFVSIGVIPFITVTHEELMMSFINERGSEKLKSVFEKVSIEDYVETFWKYFNAYPELADGADEFISSYVSEKIAHWCIENNIEYLIEND